MEKEAYLKALIGASLGASSLSHFLWDLFFQEGKESWLPGDDARTGLILRAAEEVSKRMNMFNYDMYQAFSTLSPEVAKLLRELAEKKRVRITRKLEETRRKVSQGLGAPSDGDGDDEDLADLDCVIDDLEEAKEILEKIRDVFIVSPQIRDFIANTTLQSLQEPKYFEDAAQLVSQRSLSPFSFSVLVSELPKKLLSIFKDLRRHRRRQAECLSFLSNLFRAAQKAKLVLYSSDVFDSLILIAEKYGKNPESFRSKFAFYALRSASLCAKLMETKPTVSQFRTLPLLTKRGVWPVYVRWAAIEVYTVCVYDPGENRGFVQTQLWKSVRRFFHSRSSSRVDIELALSYKSPPLGGVGAGEPQFEPEEQSPMDRLVSREYFGSFSALLSQSAHQSEPSSTVTSRQNTEESVSEENSPWESALRSLEEEEESDHYDDESDDEEQEGEADADDGSDNESDNEEQESGADVDDESDNESDNEEQGGDSPDKREKQAGKTHRLFVPKSKAYNASRLLGSYLSLAQNMAYLEVGPDGTEPKFSRPAQWCFRNLRKFSHNPDVLRAGTGFLKNLSFWDQNCAHLVFEKKNLFGTILWRELGKEKKSADLISTCIGALAHSIKGDSERQEKVASMEHNPQEAAKHLEELKNDHAFPALITSLSDCCTHSQVAQQKVVENQAFQFLEDPAYVNSLQPLVLFAVSHFVDTFLPALVSVAQTVQVLACCHYFGHILERNLFFFEEEEERPKIEKTRDAIFALPMLTVSQ